MLFAYDNTYFLLRKLRGNSQGTEGLDSTQPFRKNPANNEAVISLKCSSHGEQIDATYACYQTPWNRRTETAVRSEDYRWRYNWNFESHCPRGVRRIQPKIFRTLH